METGLLLSIIFLATTFSFIHSTKANPRADIIARICSNDYAHNFSNYLDSYSKIITQLRDELPKTKFAFKEAGEPPDKIYVLAQCMDDLSFQDCQACFSQISSLFPGCFPATGGRVYLDGCFLRGDNYSFFQDTLTPMDYLVTAFVFLVFFFIFLADISGVQNFDDVAKSVIDELVRMTPSRDGYAAYDESANGITVYGMASCWKTLDRDRCASCLASAAISAFACFPSAEGRVLNAGCFLRYSDYKFYQGFDFSFYSFSWGSLADATLSFISHVVGVVSVCILAIIIGFFIGKAAYQKRNQQNEANGNSIMRKFVMIEHIPQIIFLINEEIEVDSSVVKRSLQFKYTTLEKATDYFNEANKLGQGGFGEVFKGTLRDGREIAIKRLFITGQSGAQEVYNEIDIIGSACHKNLVRFLGCCFTRHDSFLVYEFLPNRSLDRVLFDTEKKKELPWKIRLGIIMGTAEGLEYLHKDCHVRIIHRDIKASNVLLDFRYRPKIADFGLARFYSTDRALTGTAIAGTLGYMAPEYLAQGRLTDKVDVYSYGVLILEIVSGVQNNKFQLDDSLNTLATATWKHFQSNTMTEIIDKGMEIEDMEEVTRVIQVGLLCTQESPTLRPAMTEIIQMLKQKDVSLPIPSKPPFTEENLTISPALGCPRRPAVDAYDLCISCDHSDTELR
uniref:Cysteine-rich receptor-like protein kinase 43 n=1 Tax=Vitis vinifera TaxID=29760 RepID=F6HUX8_VITVI